MILSLLILSASLTFGSIVGGILFVCGAEEARSTNPNKKTGYEPTFIIRNH